MLRHHELAHSLKCELFADRGTDISAAYDYLLSIANASDNPPAVITAAHVLVNTICNALLMDEVENETV
jgi:hypothetical protein